MSKFAQLGAPRSPGRMNHRLTHVSLSIRNILGFLCWASTLAVPCCTSADNLSSSMTGSVLAAVNSSNVADCTHITLQRSVISSFLETTHCLVDGLLVALHYHEWVAAWAWLNASFLKLLSSGYIMAIMDLTYRYTSNPALIRSLTYIVLNMRDEEVIYSSTGGLSIKWKMEEIRNINPAMSISVVLRITELVMNFIQVFFFSCLF